MHIDNIKPNDWIVVIEHIPPEMTYEQHQNYVPPELSGTPLKVKGVSPPFISCISPYEPTEVFTVNTRNWRISKCMKGYEKPFVKHASLMFPSSSLEEEFKESRTSVVHLCPICREGTFVQLTNYWKCKVCKAKLTR